MLRRAYPRGQLRELASKISKDFERIYIADEDGLFKNKPQLDIVREICDEIPSFYEGGVRYAQNVIDMIITGADRAVVGTSTLVDLDELRGAFKLSENITFKVDYRDGILSSNDRIGGRAVDGLLREVADIGIKEVLVPAGLAKLVAQEKQSLGLTLGVFAPASEKSSMEALGADYLIAEDYGSLGNNE